MGTFVPLIAAWLLTTAPFPELRSGWPFRLPHRCWVLSQPRNLSLYLGTCKNITLWKRHLWKTPLCNPLPLPVCSPAGKSLVSGSVICCHVLWKFCYSAECRRRRRFLRGAFYRMWGEGECPKSESKAYKKEEAALNGSVALSSRWAHS